MINVCVTHLKYTLHRRVVWIIQNQCIFELSTEVKREETKGRAGLEFVLFTVGHILSRKCSTRVSPRYLVTLRRVHATSPAPHGLPNPTLVWTNESTCSLCSVTAQLSLDCALIGPDHSSMRFRNVSSIPIGRNWETGKTERNTVFLLQMSFDSINTPDAKNGFHFRPSVAEIFHFY